MKTRIPALVHGLGLTLAVLLLPNQALADWGEEAWGTMVWGVSAPAVPSLPAVGLFVLALALLSTAAWRLRARKALHSALAILVVPMLAGVLSSPAHADVTVPNTLNNASVADAPAMNANFDAVLNGVNAALTTGPVSVPNTFSNGTTADADEVNANFTAVVDGVNTALANRATDCAAAGGTWDPGTSTCTAASNYNCLVGGFCAQAAIDYPPAAYGYTNVYDGHTQGADPALGAGCNTAPGLDFWQAGVDHLVLTYCPSWTSLTNCFPALLIMCQ
jgi:hypothetical protein